MPIHKVGTLIILWFYTPYPSSLLGYPFGDPFPNNVRTLSSIPQYQKKIKENFLFRFLAEKKYFVDYPLFWHSCKSWQLRRAVREAQCLGLNIFLSTCWDNFFLAWLMLKQSSKRASQIFLNIYQIIPENIPTTIRIM